MTNKNVKSLHTAISMSDSTSTSFMSRLSGFKNTRGRNRASIVQQYSIDINQTENIEDSQVDEELQNDILLGYLIGTVWKIHRVSPLHNLEYTPTRLKQYALKLKQYIVANVKEQISQSYNVEIKIIDSLKLDTKHSDALEITVSTGANSEAKVLYNALLFSWGYHAVPDGSNAKHLPLFIDRGQDTISTLVRQLLMKLFDCVITIFKFTQTDLLLFTALLSNFMPSDDFNLPKHVNFTYNVPHTRTPTQLNLTLLADDINKMWLSCFPEGHAPTIHNESMSQQLYLVFQKHIQFAYEINIAHLELTFLKYPSVWIQTEGKIRLNDLKVTKCILRILCEMSVILKGSTPKLAVDY